MRISSLDHPPRLVNEVERVGGFVSNTCWISHVKSEFGLIGRLAANRIDAKSTSRSPGAFAVVRDTFWLHGR
jgi:hypothetical protein